MADSRCYHIVTSIGDLSRQCSSLQHCLLPPVLYLTHRGPIWITDAAPWEAIRLTCWTCAAIATRGLSMCGRGMVPRALRHRLPVDWRRQPAMRRAPSACLRDCRGGLAGDPSSGVDQAGGEDYRPDDNVIIRLGERGWLGRTRGHRKAARRGWSEAAPAGSAAAVMVRDGSGNAARNAT
jgi:hypothetical protein